MEIKIKLNGQEIIAEDNKTILDIALERGIEIPTLCHDQELQPYGSCWVCAVEVAGKKGFVTACGTKITDGMEIFTDNENVYRARKLALELLLSDHYADCEAPCKLACPAQIDVQSYVSFIANRQYHEAVKVIKEKLPMPLSIGRVCPAFCEEECRRTLVEDPIAIRQLKRYCADFDLADTWSYIPEKESRKNKKVAVIGAGPSGLSCGYYLSTMGYDVIVYEESDKPGGWLRYGIPEYRLPKRILDAEIELMCQNGMQIITNTKLGRDKTLQELSKNYDAVYLALGAQKAVPMKVKGHTLKGSYLGVDFLKDFTLGSLPEIGKKVAVVGGGNTAIDCARTARRLGTEVTIIYRRTKKEMPAEPFEITASEEEGIKFYFLTNPVEYIGPSGRIEKIKLEKMKLGQPDSSGRRRPEPTGEFFTEDFDAVIAAISQEPEIDFLSEEDNKIDSQILPLTRWNTADVSENSLYTGLKNIFAGGDFRVGPATAVEAIADGKKASDVIDLYLSEDSGSFSEKIKNLEDSRFTSKKAEKLTMISPELFKVYKKISRYPIPELQPEERIKTFSEVETGYSEEAAKAEADRCLECGCLVNNCCSLRDQATDYNVTDTFFFGKINQHPIDSNHPFILRDDNKCIKCGRCIRTCSEIQGAGVLGYIYRGFSTLVAPEFGDSLDKTSCESCGKCIAVCPVGALTEKNQFVKLNPYPASKTVQNCGLCGTGCYIEIMTHSEMVYNIATPEKTDFNGKNLCFKGKFGWQAIQNDERITQPYLKTGGKLEPVIWEKAVDLITSKLKEKSNVDLLVSVDNSNEEIYMLKEIAQHIGTEIGSLSYNDCFTDELRKHENLFRNYDDLESCETILIVGEISQTIRTLCRLEQRKGKKLIMINDQDLICNKFSDIPEINGLKLCNTDDVNRVLAGLRKSNCSPEDCDCDQECLNAEAIQLELPRDTLLIYNRNKISEKTILNIWKLASLVCDFKTGSGILETSNAPNLNSFYREKVRTGIKKDADLVISYGDLLDSSTKAKYTSKPFIISFDTHFDDENQADLILPKPTYLEIDGSGFTNDSNMTYYYNPKRSNLFGIILDVFYQAGLLDINKVEPHIWHKKVIINNTRNCGSDMITKKQLVTELKQFTCSEKKFPYQTALSKQIDKLKQMTKGS